MWTTIISAAGSLFSFFAKAIAACIDLMIYRGGEKAQQNVDLNADVKADQAETKAAVDAPITKAGIQDELNKGTFG